jgi:hypothetical protein
LRLFFSCHEEEEDDMNHLWNQATEWWELRGAGDHGGKTTTSASSSSSSTTTPTSSVTGSSFPSSSSSSSSSSAWTYWDYANSSVSNAAEATYALFPSALVPTLSWPLFSGGLPSTPNPTMTMAKPAQPSSLLGLWADRLYTSRSSGPSFRSMVIGSGGGSNNNNNNNNTYNNNMSWMINNPYNSVRGGHYRHGGYRGRQSMYAVRIFLTVAPVEESNEQMAENEDETLVAAVSHAFMSESLSHRADGERRNSRSSSTGSLQQQQQQPPLSSSSNSASKQNSLTACHVAEGTIRALRDLLLDEAVELNAALRFWSDRWERPLVSWLEAGPVGKYVFYFSTENMMMVMLIMIMVVMSSCRCLWFIVYSILYMDLSPSTFSLDDVSLNIFIVWASVRGYNHRSVGNHVAQIQAVLARRCAAIGELQEHLLRAGWQRGVAQWGVLGQGGQWAPVAPGIIDGSGESSSSPSASTSRKDNTTAQQREQTIGGHRHCPMDDDSESRFDFDDTVPMGSSQISTSEPTRRPQQAGSSSAARSARIVVRKRDGGGIFVDDTSFLVKWSVEAILLVRKQLARAGNGLIAIPYGTNWIDTSCDAAAIVATDSPKADSPHDEEIVITPPDEPAYGLLPIWASEAFGRAESSDEINLPTNGENNNNSSQLAITDLPLMMEEVSELLNIMEEVVLVQRHRRLERLRPPAWWRRNWLTLVTGVPLGVWLLYKGYTTHLIRRGIRHVKSFFRERLREPLIAM